MMMSTHERMDALEALVELKPVYHRRGERTELHRPTTPAQKTDVHESERKARRRGKNPKESMMNRHVKNSLRKSREKGER
jgi:hypothetical protein